MGSYRSAQQGRNRIVLLNPVSKLHVFVDTLPVGIASLDPLELDLAIQLQFIRVDLEIIAFFKTAKPCLTETGTAACKMSLAS